MLSYFRSKISSQISSRRLRREFKECNDIILEVQLKINERNSRRRPSSPQPLSIDTEDANEADIEEDEEDEVGDGDGDDEQEDNLTHAKSTHLTSGEDKKQRDAPRLGEHFRRKLILFLEDIRSSCETFVGNSPVAPSSLSSPASGLILEEGTIDRVYGGDCTEIIVGLLTACLLGSNADQLSNSRRSLARRAASIRNTPAEGDPTIVYDCLVMLEILLREPKYQTIVAETSGSVNDNNDNNSNSSSKNNTNSTSPLKMLLQILEAVDDIQSKKLVLQTLTHVAAAPNNRLHVARAKGPKRILRLLLIRNEELFYDVMQTLRLFLVVPESNSDNTNDDMTAAALSQASNGDSSEDLSNNQSEAAPGLLSMFRELGKLMPWVEGDEETNDNVMFPSSSKTTTNTNGMGTNGSNSGNVSPTAMGDLANGFAQQDGSSDIDNGTEETTHGGKQNIVYRPSVEELSEHFNQAKIALQKEQFVLNQADVIGTGLDHDRDRGRGLSIASKNSYSTSNSMASSASNSVNNMLSVSPDILSNSFRTSGTDGVVFQEFMRSQGALHVLTRMLQQELVESIIRPEQVLEVLGALQIMLGNNTATDDFAKFGGYNILTNIPAKLVKSTELGSRRRSRQGRRLKSRSDLSTASEDSGSRFGEETTGTSAYLFNGATELTNDTDVVAAVEQDLHCFFTTILHLMVGTSTTSTTTTTAKAKNDTNNNTMQLVKTANNGELIDIKSLHVVVKLLVESPDTSIVRHSVICLLDLIKINPLNVTYVQTFGAINFMLHHVTNSELMSLFAGTALEWDMRMDAMNAVLLHAAVPLLSVDTTILQHYISSIKQYLLSVVEGPQNMRELHSEQSWVSTKSEWRERASLFHYPYHVFPLF